MDLKVLAQLNVVLQDFASLNIAWIIEPVQSLFSIDMNPYSWSVNFAKIE